MTNLDAETRLSRAPGLQMDIDGAGLVQVRINGQVVRPGADALAVLAAAGDDPTIHEIVGRVLATSPGSSPTGIVEAITALAGVGALVPPDSATFSPLPLSAGGYDSVYVHLKMLNDLERKRAFIAGVQAAVKPGDTVLDIGSGSGVLAIAAARAGASSVTAVEPSAIGSTVEESARRSGIPQGVVQGIRGWSSSLPTGAQFDVISCDLLGNDPLDMSLWEIFTDARERLMKSGGVTVPAGVSIRATLIDIPESTASQHRVSGQHVGTWLSALEMDFSVLQERQPQGPHLIHERPETVRDFERLSTTADLGLVDFSLPAAPLTLTACVTATRACKATALVIHGLVHLAPDTTFETSPWLGSSRSHWYTPVWILPEAVSLNENDSATITYRYLGAGVSVVEVVPTEAASGHDAD